MAEFKITRSFDAEVGALKAGAQAINEMFAAASSDGVDSLPTARAFIQEQAQLKELLALYASLVEKDARDLTKMIADVRAMDEKVAKAYK